MDPLSIATSVVSLASVCLAIAKKLGDVNNRFKGASQLVNSLHSEVKIVGFSLSQLQGIILGDADAIPSTALLNSELLSTVDIALTGCAVTLSCLDDEIRSLVAKSALDDGLSFAGRAEVVWKDDKFKELLQQLRGQYGAITLLLHGLQMKSLSEIHHLLNENKTTIQQIAESSQLLRRLYPQIKVAKSVLESPCEVDSAFGNIDPASASEKEFEFDDQVTNSKAYRRILTNATQTSRKVIEEDLLDLGSALVDISENPETDDSIETSKPSHDLNELILPISNRALEIEEDPGQPYPSTEPEIRDDCHEEVLEIESEDQLSGTVASEVDDMSSTSVRTILSSKGSSASIELVTERVSITHHSEMRSLHHVSSVGSPITIGSTSRQDVPIKKASRLPKPAIKANQSHKSTSSPQDGKQNAESEPPHSRSSFPHPYERWDTISAHWEGLVSFWVRHMEEKSNEINSDSITQQLARQVTDLSAAGGNLFHAVVELQRLRASSERKFQRWFFETRAEMERAGEIRAVLENDLHVARAEVVGLGKSLEVAKASLQVSKEEARRAWMELGRREQEERDRVHCLQQGEPVVIGGITIQWLLK